MKDYLVKLVIILLVGLTESVVGLPILFAGLALQTTFTDQKFKLAWLVGAGLLLAFFWGFAWWLGVVLIYVNQLLYQKLRSPLTNSWSRVVILVVPMVLVVALVAGIGFSWRILGYGTLSSGLIILSNQLWFSSKYQKKYL